MEDVMVAAWECDDFVLVLEVCQADAAHAFRLDKQIGQALRPAKQVLVLLFNLVLFLLLCCSLLGTVLGVPDSLTEVADYHTN